MRNDSRLLKGFTIQQSQDMAQIALHREFEFTSEEQARFVCAFRGAFVDFAGLCVEDGADDKEIWYTKDTLDRALKEACGEILPFDDRYDEKRLYFRDTMKKWEEECGR